MRQSKWGQRFRIRARSPLSKLEKADLAAFPAPWGQNSADKGVREFRVSHQCLISEGEHEIDQRFAVGF